MAGWETKGQARRGPEPILIGKAVVKQPQPEARGLAKVSWWLDCPRERFSSVVQERANEGWGEFANKSASYAPDAFPPPRKKVAREI